jgi:pseudouridine synthase
MAGRNKSHVQKGDSEIALLSDPQNSKTEKLAKYLARSGVASRRRSEEHIRAGWVKVNGEIVTTPETRIDSETASVEVQGIMIKPVKIFQYIMLHKPVGYLCTCKKGREKGHTLLDLVKPRERLFPAGRLDRDTSGLVLLTNDGELVQKLIHPSFQQEREYLIIGERPISSDDLAKMQKGVLLDDGLSKFSKVRQTGKNSMIVILKEGRKRQIRRTFQTLGVRILKLHRIRFGCLHLGDLPEGQWRELIENEINQLKT